MDDRIDDKNKTPFFIISRLGIGLYDPARLTKMIDIFELVTLPSLRNQTVSNFYLLMVVDINIPQHLFRRIEELFENLNNFRVVGVNVTNLTEVYLGNFSWVWGKCQDYILQNNLIKNREDFVLTSILDADDAWHKSTVEIVSQNIFPRIHALENNEANKATWVRHSAGVVATFPNGFGWLMHHDRLYPINFPFHSMSIFVLCRFSSNISACSSRHSKWKSYAEVVDFEIGSFNDTPPMWIYTRHDEGVVSYKLDGSEAQIDSKFTSIFHDIFGIDLSTIQNLNRHHSPNNYQGKKASDQYNLIFQISALNRHIQAKKTLDITNELQHELSDLERQKSKLVETLNELHQR